MHTVTSPWKGTSIGHKVSGALLRTDSCEFNKWSPKNIAAGDGIGGSGMCEELIDIDWLQDLHLQKEIQIASVETFDGRSTDVPY